MTSLSTTVLLLSLAALSGSKHVDNNACSFSEWSAWGQCLSTEQQQYQDMPFSFPLPATSQADRGRAMMKHNMKHKVLSLYARQQCQEEGTCPEYNPRPAVKEEQPCTEGYAGDYPCRNVDLLSHLNIEDLGYTKEIQDQLREYAPAGNDIWGWTDPATQREYAIIGLTGGTSFVDVTEPTEPKVLAFLITRTFRSTWRDIKVINNTAYIVSEARDHGLQVFDLLRLREITSLSYVTSDVDYSKFGNAHNIVSNEETNTLFVVGATQRKIGEYRSCSGGLHMIDVSDRLNPKFAGCFADDGYVHDAQCVIYHGPDVRYQNHEVCFCYNEDTLTLVDTTDKDEPKLISKNGYNLAMYTHQGWVTEDHTTILLDDELDEAYYVSPDESRKGHTITYLWDVTDLKEPALKQHYISTEPAIDHNQYILGDLTYQSNYGAGLRILHIDQANYGLSEVAYFDVLPSSQPRPKFEGSWSNYPYFKSGHVIVSSIESGLYVVRPNMAAIQKAIDEEEEYKQQTRTRTILHAHQHSACAAVTQTQQCPDV